MRILGLLLGYTLLAIASVCDAYLDTYRTEPSMLQWKPKMLSKKGEGGSSDRNKHGGKSSRKGRKRGLFSRKSKKDKVDNTYDDSTLDANGENNSQKRGKTHKMFKKNKKNNRGKKGLFSRKKKNLRESPGRHERHHKDVTDALHEQIDKDQHEPVYKGNSLVQLLSQASKRVKDHLMKNVSRDIDTAMQELAKAH